jgi:hypothetical protein
MWMYAMQGYSRAMRKLLSVAVGVLLCGNPLWGSDAATTISQDALTAYALSAGINSGSATFPVTATFVTLHCSSIKCDTNGPGGHGICHLSGCVWEWTTITLWEQSVNWVVVSPAFAITPLGVSFSGKLVIAAPGVTAAPQAFTLPASATFDASSSTLVLTVSSNTVTVPVTVAGATYPVFVNLSPYYTIRMPLVPATLNVSGHNVTGSLQNVSFQYGNGSLTVLTDFSFH